MTTKEKLIQTTANLIQIKGFYGTGINEILEISKIPKGSLYHHFPLGKDDLVSEALLYAGSLEIDKYSIAAKGKKSAEDVLSSILDNLAEQLVTSNYQKGCPIATVALEVSSNNEKIRNICSEVFLSMQGRLAAFLRLANENNPQQKAKTFFTLLEGAFILSKVHKNETYLLNAKEQIRFIVE